MHKKYLSAAIVWTGFITMMSLLSSSSLKGMNVVQVPNTDKFVHFVFYCILTLAWFFAFKNKYRNRSKLLLYVFLSAVLYGILIELCQFMFKWGRDGELLDVVANTIGSASAILVLSLNKKNIK